MTGVVRLATAADADALVRLRAAMFLAMGRDVGPEDAPWRRAASAWFADQLGRSAVAVVAETEQGVIASALAVLLPRPPGPDDATPFAAHVSQVSTLPEHRRRGYATACLRRLLEVLEDRGIGRADLHATADGEGVYRALGFVEPRYPALRRQAPPRAG